MSLLVQPGLVSTIIPVFNRPKLVVEAINSVLDQTYRPIEVIVVDDGSSDDTPEIVKSLIEQHPEIKLLSQNNRGPGVARELGRLNARGEYIQYLDSDDLLLPNKFEDQITALNSKPHADIAYGKTETIRVDTEPKGRADSLTGTQVDSMFPTFLRERWWSTSTPLYTREVTEKAGPWLAEINEEDWEYETRIASFGGVLAYTDSWVSLTRRHDDHLSEGGSLSTEKLKARAMSRARIFRNAQTYMNLNSRPCDIRPQDWRFFSDYAFLLARQCAGVGLKTEARAMLTVSIEAIDKKTWQHKVFIKLVKLFGWKIAAELIVKVKG